MRYVSALLSQLLPTTRDADVFIITPTMQKDYDIQIKAYKKRNNTVTILNTGR